MSDATIFSEEEKRLLSRLQELIDGQRRVFLACAQRIVPSVTEEDLLQVNDFSALELHPYVRYEEGVLAGLLAAAALLQCPIQGRGRDIA